MVAGSRIGHVSRRGILFGGLLGTAGLAAHFSGEALHLLPSNTPPLEDIVPRRIGQWRFAGTSGLVLPSDKLEAEAYDQELKRIYVAGGDRMVMLVIAYSGRPRHGLLALHDPEVCYSGGGYSLTNVREEAVPLASGTSLPVQSFTARSPWRIEEVVYWTRIGNEIRSASERQHLVILNSVFRGEIPDGVLVRISTLGSGPEKLADIRQFAAELLRSAPERGRRLLLGGLAATASGIGGAI